MADWGLIAIRFALYADLMLLVGLSAFPLYSFPPAEREAPAVLTLSGLLTGLIIAGLTLSVAGFAVAAAAMMGMPLSSLDGTMLVSMANETAVGTAWYVRLMALATGLLGLLVIRPNQTAKLPLLLVSGTIALATVLWSGHAGATEGALGIAHRVSDIAHMIAAALWIGGIAAFGLLLHPPANTLGATHVAVVARALVNFAPVGTVAVLIIVLTGLFNGFVISGADVSSVIRSNYGMLLTAKILLFGAMLGLAANNRWRLIPALDRLLATEDAYKTWNFLRISVGLETAAGTGILILVAWLGTLSPH